MKALEVTIVALVSIFTVSVLWVSTRGPFGSVITQLNSSLTAEVSAPAAQAIGNLATMYVTGATVFIIVTILSLVYWWWAKMQEREVVTEGYTY